MIVRCGRCRIELEVAGPGEFMCPSCGTRNAVRGAGPSMAPDPFDLRSSMPSAPPPADEPSGIRWIVCPSCRYRFAVGEVDEAPCPACGTDLSVSGDEVSIAG